MSRECGLANWSASFEFSARTALNVLKLFRRGVEDLLLGSRVNVVLLDLLLGTIDNSR